MIKGKAQVDVNLNYVNRKAHRMQIENVHPSDMR